MVRWCPDMFGKRQAQPSETTTARCVIVSDDADCIAALRAPLAGAGYPDPAIMKAEDFVAQARALVPDLVLVDGPEETELRDRLLKRLARSGQPGAVIVIAREGSAHAARFAVRVNALDLVHKPVNPQALAEALERLAAGPSDHQCRITVLHGVAGGVGATSLALAIAAEHADRAALTETDVALVDLDLHTGAAALSLDLPPTGGLGDLLEAADRLDSEYLEQLLPIYQGVRLFSFGDPARAADHRVPHLVYRTLELLEPRHAHLILDLPARPERWADTLFASADDIVLVGRPSVPCLRLVRARRDSLLDQGIDAARIHVVINRVRKGWRDSSLDREAIGQALGEIRFETIREDVHTFDEAGNLGLFPQDVRQRGAVGDLARLIRELDG